MKLLENLLNDNFLCDHPGAETSLHCIDDGEGEIDGFASGKFANSPFVSK